MSSVTPPAEQLPSYNQAIGRAAHSNNSPDADAISQLRSAFLSNARAQLRPGEELPDELVNTVYRSEYPRMVRGITWRPRDVLASPLHMQWSQEAFAKDLAGRASFKIRHVVPQIRRDFETVYGHSPTYRQMTVRLKHFADHSPTVRLYELMNHPRIVSIALQPPSVLPEDVRARQASDGQRIELRGRYVHLSEARLLGGAAIAAGVVLASISLFSSLSIGVGAVLGAGLVAYCAAMFGASSRQAGHLQAHQSLRLGEAFLSTLPFVAVAALMVIAPGTLLFCLLPLTPFAEWASTEMQKAWTQSRFLQTSLADRICPRWAPCLVNKDPAPTAYFL